jgi:hypothetical protein
VPAVIFLLKKETVESTEILDVVVCPRYWTFADAGSIDRRPMIKRLMGIVIRMEPLTERTDSSKNSYALNPMV